MFAKKNTVLEMPADAAAAAGGAAQGYGGFWIRFLAYLADGAIITFALIILILPAAFLGEFGAMIYGIVCLVGPFLYFAVMQSSARQATFGKDLLGLKVMHAGSGERLTFVRSLLRELAKILSALILAIGFIMAAFTSRKQGLHDLLAATVVTREKSPRVVAAIVVIVAGIVIPFIVLPLMLGAFMGGMLLAVMGPLMGGMMGGMIAGDTGKASRPVPQVTQPAPKSQAGKSAPPAAAAKEPPAGAALSEAEYDKLLARPLSGLDAPSSAHAGPALLQISTYFGGSEPNIWVKVMLPPVPNLELGRSTVTINRVLDARGQDRYHRDSSFEKEFFRRVSLSESRSGVPRYEGTRSVRLQPGTAESDVQNVEGVLNLSLPVGLARLSLSSADAGKERQAGPVKITLKSLSGQEASFSIEGNAENFLGAKGYDASGGLVEQESSMRGGNNYTLKYRAPVAKIDVAAASSLLTREYPFKLVRGQSAPAAATAATPSAAPEKPAAVVVAPAKPAVPEKPAAVAPAPAKPAAPEKSAAVALVPAKPAVVEMKTAPARPAAKAAPADADKPRVARRAAPRPPAAAPVEVPAAPVTPPKMPRYNDVMTAVLKRDRAGAAEALDAGFWVDRRDSNGATPLMAAARNGDFAMAQLLLQHGADPNLSGPDGSVLSYAVRGGDGKLVALLKKAGAR